MTASTVSLEQQAAHRAWILFRSTAQGSLLDAHLDGWQESGSPVGVLLSARVDGADASRAVVKFAEFEPTDRSETLGPSTCPQLDYTLPGRVACVWQSNGVWMELWAPDTVPASDTPAEAAPNPITAPSPPARSPWRVLSRPSGRLPYTRRTKTPKETPTA